MEIKEAQWSGLKEAKDYRDFLRTYLESRSIRKADLARATGFGRGFPGDVISGRRRLTARSCFAFEKALRIPSNGKRLFRYLVAQAEPDLFPNLDPEKVATEIQKLRTQTWNRSHRLVKESEAPSVRNAFLSPLAALVYAASGEPERGATLDEIAARTNLTETQLQPVLRSFIISGLLQEKQDRLYPQDLHLFLQSQDKSELISHLFQKGCQIATKRVDAALQSESEFFFTSALCVDEKRLPELKRALRATILKFVDEAIDPSGDRVVRVLTALHR